MGVFQGVKKKYLFTGKILSILGGEDVWKNLKVWLVNLTFLCFCLIYYHILFISCYFITKVYQYLGISMTYNI